MQKIKKSLAEGKEVQLSHTACLPSFQEAMLYVYAFKNIDIFLRDALMHF